MDKICLITGASSGIGKDLAYILSKNNYSLLLTGRNIDSLKQIKEELKDKVLDIFIHDLSKEEECLKLYEETKNYNVDVLINNAGFGVFGEFINTDLNKELAMIKTNVIAPQMLIKLFLNDFTNRDIEGMIINICSSASFYSGPLMASYYATKSYLYRLTLALQVEEKKRKSKNHLMAICPGPVLTNFQNVADVKFATKPITSEYLAKLIYKGMKKKKKVIIPTFKMKCGKFFSHFVSDRFIAKIAYNFQKKKK